MMTPEEIKARYKALEPIATNSMNDTWVDKLIPFEQFMENGETVAELFSQISPGTYEKTKTVNPELHDLVLAVFGKT